MTPLDSEAWARAAFDEYTSQFGGRLDTQIEDPFSEWMAPYRSHVVGYLRRLKSAVRSPDWKVDADYVADFRFNARAARHMQTDLIVLFRGIPIRLRTMFQILISYPTSFPETAGVTQDERTQIKGITPEAVIRGIGVFAEAHPPENARLRKLCEELISAAVFFAYCHEEGHIINGHLDLKSVVSIDECEVDLTCNNAGLIRQTLEFDADAYAVQRVVQFGLDSRPRIKNDSKLLTIPASGKFGDMEEATKKMAFALYVCCKMFERPGCPTTAADILASQKHPPAFFRAQSAINQMATVMNISGDIPFDVAAKAAIAGVVDAERSWAAGFDTPFQNPLDHQALVHELLAAYTAQWKVLRPRLRKVAGTGRLAPAEPSMIWTSDAPTKS